MHAMCAVPHAFDRLNEDKNVVFGRVFRAMRWTTFLFALCWHAEC
jgi:hypothetical protein